MSIPKLTEVFVVQEAPLDWKKSFKKASSALQKTGIPGIAKGIEVPKGPRKPPEARPARSGGPSDDPLKTTSSAELFQTDAGDYYVSKGVGGMYHAIFVSADMKKVEDLGQHGSRRESIDSVLAHHDKLAAGLGEEAEREGY